MLLWCILKHNISGSQGDLNTRRDDMVPVANHRGNVGRRTLAQTYTREIIGWGGSHSNEQN